MASTENVEKIPPSRKTLGEGGGVLILGLPRSGTFSMCHAMRVLGLKNVLHELDDQSNDLWLGWYRAAWASLPYMRENFELPSWAKKNPPPEVFTKADWDGLVGHLNAVGDASVFVAAEMIKAYPDAQVILWERDIDSWYKSMDKHITSFGTGMGALVRKYIGPLSGFYWPTMQWQCQAGWTRGKTIPEMRANLKSRYHEHFATVRKLVKPGKLLEYRMGSGWKPLCEFLEAAEPQEPFPHLNTADSMNSFKLGLFRELMSWAIFNVVKYPLLIGAGAIIVKLIYPKLTTRIWA